MEMNGWKNDPETLTPAWLLYCGEDVVLVAFDQRARDFRCSRSWQPFLELLFTLTKFPR